MNSLSIVGRAGKDAETKAFETGKVKTSFSLAVDQGRKDRDGNKLTDWFNCECWGKTAEIAGDYVKRGGLVGVVGSIHNERYTDREGNQRDTWKVDVKDLRLLGSKSSGGQAEGEDGSIPF